jgi:hypothetical protein
LEERDEEPKRVDGEQEGGGHHHLEGVRGRVWVGGCTVKVRALKERDQETERVEGEQEEGGHNHLKG